MHGHIRQNRQFVMMVIAAVDNQLNGPETAAAASPLTGTTTRSG
jgi:hypothetical protein